MITMLFIERPPSVESSAGKDIGLPVCDKTVTSLSQYISIIPDT